MTAWIELIAATVLVFAAIGWAVAKVARSKPYPIPGGRRALRAAMVARTLPPEADAPLWRNTIAEHARRSRVSSWLGGAVVVSAAVLLTRDLAGDDALGAALYTFVVTTWLYTLAGDVDGVRTSQKLLTQLEARPSAAS